MSENVEKKFVTDLCEFFLGVTTIAGGKSNVAGYRDGPSEDAKFSNDYQSNSISNTCLYSNLVDYKDGSNLFVAPIVKEEY